MNIVARGLLHRIGSPLRALARWLARVPATDPVDRRNAPMLQILLLLLASLPPLMWAYRLLATDIPWRPGETLSLASSLTLSALAAFSVYLIRRGRVQWAVRQLMVVVAAVMMLSYLGNGFDANRYEQPVQAVWLVIAGLMIGRRALWLMLAWTALAFALGTRADIAAGVQAAAVPAQIMVDALISALIFLFIAIVLDRSVAALRESLQAATLRGDELNRSKQRLEAEIAERERVQDQLIHAQKVEAVGRLAAGVAHDFNHLLGLILGHASRGRRGGVAEMEKALEGVESAARRASAISQKLLNFSRLDEARPEIFDAGQALREMQPTLRQLFGPAVSIRMALPEQAQPIRFDRAHFDLMILNVAANADHAMPDGGDFHLQLQPAPAGGRLAIELRDTGHGMDETVRARIFEAFYTTKPAGQGTGLGLAIVDDLVTDAGGAIHVESALGQGAAFRIELPLAPQPFEPG